MTEPEGTPAVEPPSEPGIAPGPSSAGDPGPTPAPDSTSTIDVVDAAPIQPSVQAREVLGRALDLSLAASGDVRRTAILIGLLFLAAAGPYAAILLALVSHIGGFAVVLGDALMSPDVEPIGNDLLSIINLSGLIGLGCLIALLIDSQLLAVTVLASRATGRRYVLRNALQLVRMRFWRLLRANLIIAVILFLPRLLIQRTIAPGGVATESQFVSITLIGVVLSIPFAYVAAWIMLGPVGSRESIRRSWRLARSRLPVAATIAVINILFQTVALFALGAAFEVIARIADVMHLSEATGPALFGPIAVVLALVLAAAGSLLMTISALTAAPVVVAFLGLTGVTNGLDVLHDPDNPFATPHRERLVSLPMLVALAIEAALAAYAISRIL